MGFRIGFSGNHRLVVVQATGTTAVRLGISDRSDADACQP